MAATIASTKITKDEKAAESEPSATANRPWPPAWLTMPKAAKELAPYLKEKFESLGDHPMVGEVKVVGMMGSLALTPDKTTRAKFAADVGTVGFMVRERCFANNLIMRHVGDRMVISPPLVITKAEIDTLIVRARKALDEGYENVKAAGLFKAMS